MKNILLDRKYRLPRIWSNKELKKFAHLFSGEVINVSGWKDSDKQGNYYKDYFIKADKYYISNYKSEWRGLQGFKNEIFLDLSVPLQEDLINRFDVVFCHTVLEHIYETREAFRNLCLMSRDIVIIVVPFLQQMHSHYGDYWRFSPLAIKRMFEDNKYKLLYLNFNNQKNVSVYIFAIASKKLDRWKNKIEGKFDYRCSRLFLDFSEDYIGCRAISNNILVRFRQIGHYLIKRLKK